MAAGSDDGSVRVFAADTGAELVRLDHDEWVNTVAFAYLASCFLLPASVAPIDPASVAPVVLPP